MRKIMCLSVSLIFCDELLCMSSAVHTSGVLCNGAVTGSSRELVSSMRLMHDFRASLTESILHIGPYSL